METLNEMMNAVIWQCNRFFKYYLGNIRNRFKNRHKYSWLQLFFSPISLIPMCFMLMRQDFQELYQQMQTTKEIIGGMLDSVRGTAS